MALDSYANLKTEIVDWLARTDLTSNIDTFIDLTEAELNRRLRLRTLENRTTLSITSQWTSLPSDFLEMRHIAIDDSPDTILEYVAPDAFTNLGEESGTPKFYTIIGDELGVYPSTSCTAAITYYEKIDALSDSTTTNIILQDHPELYLFGGLKYANAFIKDKEEEMKWLQMFEGAVSSIQGMSRASKLGVAMMMRLA